MHFREKCDYNLNPDINIFIRLCFANSYFYIRVASIMAGAVLIETKDRLASLIWSASAFQWTIVLLVLALIVGRYMVTKRVRYAKAPIAGIRQGESVVAARERFRTEAQQMFIEGYTKVRISHQIAILWMI